MSCKVRMGKYIGIHRIKMTVKVKKSNPQLIKLLKGVIEYLSLHL